MNSIRGYINSGARYLFLNSPYLQRMHEQYRARQRYRLMAAYLLCTLIIAGLCAASFLLMASGNSSEGIVRRKITKHFSSQLPIVNKSVFFLFLVLCLLLLLFLREYRRERRIMSSLAAPRMTQMDIVTSQLAVLTRLGLPMTEETILRFNLSLRRGNFDPNDYELLQALDGDNFTSLGATEQQLDRLPVHTVSKEEEMSCREDNRTCSVCLGAFEEGESLRTISCFHNFHKDCIDRWLMSNPTCPICKVYAVE